MLWFYRQINSAQELYMNIDHLIDNIMESYEQQGGINRSGAENFPNRQNVVSVLSDLQFLIFPGFK